MAVMQGIHSGYLGRILAHTAAEVTNPPSTKNDYANLFTTQGTDFDIIPNVAQMPSLGSTPNLKDVAEFGRQTARMVQTQSSGVSLELSVNFDPSQWTPGTTFGDFVTQRRQTAFAAAFVDAEPPNFQMTQATAGDPWLGDVNNWVMFWTGRFEAIVLEASTDSESIARVTITLTSPMFYGPYGF